MSARQRLIDTTIALVRRRGVGSASISQILEQSGLARRTLYLNFPDGKPELVAAATESAASGFASMLEGIVIEGDPVASVEAFVRAWDTALADSDYGAGCPIVAATLGSSEAPAAAQAAAERLHAVGATHCAARRASRTGPQLCGGPCNHRGRDNRRGRDHVDGGSFVSPAAAGWA